MQFNRSTELRVLTVTVGLHTFDGKLLDYFQHDPVLLRNYFALFVGYMQQYGKTLEPSFYKEYQAARNHYEKILPDLRRYCDTAAQLELAVSVLERFLRFHEITDSDLVSNLRTAIRSGLTEHAKRSVTAEPTRLFLDALFNSISIGTEDKDCGIANTEADFCNKRRNYIGFLAQGTDETMLWMRFNSAFKLVTGYYRDFGDDFILKEATIKSSLLDKALILKGNNSAYLCKQKGTGKQRENLMVFRFEKIKEYLANERS